MVQNVMKILVVDDEEYICEILQEFLSLKGYQVDTAANGEDALKKYEADRPDVVLLDIRMPGMGGVDILRRIKEIDSRAGIIMLSAFGDAETVNEVLQMGADYYLQKPVEFDRLMEILTSLQESSDTGDSDDRA
ncbi:MAG: response regulator [Thermodesulfobacteriota bacterium]|nr:response regulator [Thermodesulfobacteriota bacterium]